MENDAERRIFGIYLNGIGSQKTGDRKESEQLGNGKVQRSFAEILRIGINDDR